MRVESSEVLNAKPVPVLFRWHSHFATFKLIMRQNIKFNKLRKAMACFLLPLVAVKISREMALVIVGM